jgi:hypothetical protein
VENIIIQKTRNKNRNNDNKISTNFTFKTPFLAGPSKDIGKTPKKLNKVRTGFEAVKQFSMFILSKVTKY